MHSIERGISRPLRTGTNFVLARPAPVLVRLLSWSATDVEAGALVELRVAGSGLREPVELIVERETDDGAWAWAASVEAQPAADGASAVAQWTVPRPGDPVPARAPDDAAAAEPGVSVSELAFDDAPALDGDTAWMHARVAGLEGRQVQVLLDREDEGGTFVEVGEATAVVHTGEVHAGIPLH